MLLVSSSDSLASKARRGKMGPSAAGDEEPIYNLATECEELFEKGACLGSLAEAGAVQLWEEHRERFTTWAAYLGVFAKRSLCLDRRLEHHPTLQDLVLRLLDILRGNLTCGKTAWDCRKRAQANSFQKLYLGEPISVGRVLRF